MALNGPLPTCGQFSQSCREGVRGKSHHYLASWSWREARLGSYTIPSATSVIFYDIVVKERLGNDESKVSSMGCLSSLQSSAFSRFATLHSGTLRTSGCSAAAVVEGKTGHRRKLWPDAKPLVKSRTTRKAVLLLKQIKPEELPDEELMDCLRTWVKSMDPVRRDFLDVMKELDNWQTIDVLFKVSEWVLGEDWFEANIRDYTKLLERYGKVGRLEDMERTFQELQADGFVPDLIAYSVLIGAYGRHCKVAEAERAFEALTDSGNQPDAKVYTSLMVAYGRDGQPEKAEKLLKEMQLNGVSPTAVTYTVLINGYARKGLTGDAQRIFDQMRSQSPLTPDARCFTALMDAYGKAGQLEKAIEVYEAMKAGGVMLDDTALGLLVEACGRHGRYREAVQLVLQYEAGGQRPGIDCLSALIGVFGREGLVEEAEEVFLEMRQAGIEPLPKTYARLYFAYAKAGLLEKAEKTKSDMVTMGWDLNPMCCNLMLEGLVEGGHQSEALELFSKMKSKSFEISADIEQDGERLVVRRVKKVNIGIEGPLLGKPVQ